MGVILSLETISCIVAAESSCFMFGKGLTAHQTCDRAARNLNRDRTGNNPSQRICLMFEMQKRMCDRAANYNISIV